MGSATAVLLLRACVFLFLSGCTTLVFQPSKESFFELDPKRVLMEERWISSTDAVQLHSWYFPAQRDLQKTKSKGLVIQFHGNAQNLTAHFLSMVWVIEEGFDFWAVDYRGYGNSTGAPDPEGAVKDVESVIREAITTAPGPIYLIGQSLGGALLMKAMINLRQTNSDLAKVQSVVIDSSFYSYSKIATDVLSRSWLTWPFQWLGYLLISDQQSPGDSISKISPTPLLVIHGDADSVVPQKFGKRIHELAAEPKTFWPVAGGRHIDTFVSPVHGEEYRGRLLKYWEGLKR